MENDFKNLYNIPEDATSEFDEEFYAWAKTMSWKSARF